MVDLRFKAASEDSKFVTLPCEGAVKEVGGEGRGGEGRGNVSLYVCLVSVTRKETSEGEDEKREPKHKNYPSPSRVS